MIQREKSELWLLGSVLLLTLIFFVFREAYAGSDQVLFGDGDDVMRMVVVRDFLAGQNWFDHSQYRLNTPYGGEMHWSRLVDLPIAAIVLLARPLAGSSAETVAGYLWPTILLGVLIWLNGKLTLRLVGRDGLLPGMLITAFSVITFGEFSFGRVDHHSVQIILTQVTVLFTVMALERPRAAIGAGLALATSLAIGTETLPVVVAVICAFGLFYVFAPRLFAAVRWFGLAFGLGTLGHLLLAQPPSLWFSPACDALSIVYAVAAVGAGLGLAALTSLPIADSNWLLRLVFGVGAGTAVVALVVLLFPECLAGPYANVDPWLVENWLNGVVEAKPVLEVFRSQPDFVVGASVPALLALTAASHAAWRSQGQKWIAWMVVVLVLATVIAVAFVQIRSIRLTLALIAPACAYWVVLARQHYLRRVTASSVLGLVGSWIGFAGTLWAAAIYSLIGTIAAAPASGSSEALPRRAECLMPSAFEQLASLPPARIMTPSDVGPYVLRHTRHEVVSAPYHRNNQAMLDTFAFHNGPIEEARYILDRRGVTLVVTCFALPEMQGNFAEASFVSLVREDNVPWLRDITENAGSPLRIYAVEPR